MKVLLVSGIYPPDIGGPATFVPKFRRFLEIKGIDTFLITLGSKTEGGPSSIKLARDAFFPVRFLRTVLKIRSQIDPNTHIFANGLHEEVAIALIGKRNRATAKIVGDPVWERQRNKKKTTLEIDEFSQSKLTLIAGIQRKLLNWSLKKFDAIIVPGANLKSMVQSWDLNLPPITVINNGVEISRKEHSGKKNFDVIAVSRLVPWKNLDLLIEACADLGLRLKVVGDGPSRSELEDLTLKFGAETTFTGEIEEHLIYREIASSEVYALISSYEGQSFSLLQAMAAGAAILVSDAPGNANVIRDNWSGLISTQKLDEIKVGLEKLFADRGLRKRLGDNARLEAEEKYNIEVTLVETKKIVFDE